MDFDLKHIADFFSFLLVPVSLFLGWLSKKFAEMKIDQKELKADMEAFKTDFYETKVHAAGTYVRHDDYRADQQAIHGKLDKILDKLDGKADK